MTDASPAAVGPIDVIVRTLADAQRAANLFQALDSIQATVALNGHVIVVANGKRADPGVMKALRERPDTTLVYSPIPSAGQALVLGRREVSAPVFAFLDDDDLLLGDAVVLALARAYALEPDWDVVITKGKTEAGDPRDLVIADLSKHAQNPLISLINENWLSPGASFFRTHRVSADLIDVNRDHHEWTHIAFRLATSKFRLAFVDLATVFYRNTGGSMSKRDRHYEEQIDLLDELGQAQNLDARVRRVIMAKRANTLHTLASRQVSSGAYAKAWRYHLRSLRPPHTFKYLLYTRKLLGLPVLLL